MHWTDTVPSISNYTQLVPPADIFGGTWPSSGTCINGIKVIFRLCFCLIPACYGAGTQIYSSSKSEGHSLTTVNLVSSDVRCTLQSMA